MGIPVIGFAGWSGSGKTTMIERLIPLLMQKSAKVKGRPYRVAVIKHDVHGVKLAEPYEEPGAGQDADAYVTSADAVGTDTWRFRKAGADPVILCGPEGPGLNETLQVIGGSSDGMPETLTGPLPDLILVEGFKRADIPKIGIARKANGKGFTDDVNRFLAVVTDLEVLPAEKALSNEMKIPAEMKMPTDAFVPVFGFDDTEALADFILKYMARV